MTRITLILAVALSLTGPLATSVAAQSLDLLLPSLTFPEDPVVLSTKGCDAPATKVVCQLAE